MGKKPNGRMKTPFLRPWIATASLWLWQQKKKNNHKDYLTVVPIKEVNLKPDKKKVKEARNMMNKKKTFGCVWLKIIGEVKEMIIEAKNMRRATNIKNR